jgi:hypothetical protein
LVPHDRDLHSDPEEQREPTERAAEPLKEQGSDERSESKA